MQNGDLILEMENINQSFFGVQVLFDAGIQLRAGEIHALVGENGAGKTTLIKILCGMYPEYTGKITIDGQQVTMRDPRQAHDYGVFSVQQHRDLVPTMTAVENMFLGNYILKKSGSIDNKEMRRKAQEMFALFETTIDTDVPVSELKISEQEIIAICKAISSNGKIFLIDEASAPLDNRERGILYGILRKLCEEGKGVIYISHHLEEVFTIGDRVTVLRNGRNVWTKNTSETDASDIISAMTGDKKLYERVPRPEISDEDHRVPVFEFENVSGSDLDDVSLKILKSEIVGFAGLDGSGTKEIAEMMFGLTKPKNGSIDYNGNPVLFKYPIKAIRSNIAMIPTERKVQGLAPCRSVAENIVISAIAKGKQPFFRKGAITKTASKYVEDFGIVTASTDQIVEYLSGGNQQKVLVTKWIETNMDVLICVEPTEGVDVGARADIYRIMHRLAEEGKTIIIISSDIDELLALCDRIFTLNHGKITGVFDAGSVEKTRILSEILTKKEADGAVA